MKKVMAMVLVLCLVLSMGAIGVNAQTFKQNQVIDEAISFRGVAKSTYSTLAVTDNISLRGTYYVKSDENEMGSYVYPYNGGLNAGCYIGINNFDETIRTGVVELSFDFKNNATTNSQNTYILMSDNGSTGNDDPAYLGTVSFAEAGSTGIRNMVRFTPNNGGVSGFNPTTGSGAWRQALGGAFNDGQWRNVKLILNYDNETINLTFDGVDVTALWGGTFGVISPSVHGLKGFRIYSYSDPTACFDNVSVKHIPTGKVVTNDIMIDYKGTTVETENGKIYVNFSDKMKTTEGKTIAEAITAGMTASDLGIVVKGEDGNAILNQPTVSSTDTGVLLNFATIEGSTKYIIDVDTTGKMTGAANGMPAIDKAEFTTASASYDFANYTTGNLPAGLFSWQKDNTQPSGIYAGVDPADETNTYIRLGTTHIDPANHPRLPEEALCYRFGSTINSGKVEVSYKVRHKHTLNEDGTLKDLGDGLASYFIFDTDNDGIDSEIDETGLRTGLITSAGSTTGIALLNPLAPNYEYYAGSDKIVNAWNKTQYSSSVVYDAYANDWINFKWVLDYDTGNVEMFYGTSTLALTKCWWNWEKTYPDLKAEGTPALEGIAFAGIQNVNPDGTLDSNNNEDGNVGIDDLKIAYYPSSADETPTVFEVNDFRVYESIDNLSTADNLTDKVWIPYVAETLTDANNTLKLMIKGYNPGEASTVDLLLAVYSSGEYVLEDVKKVTVNVATGEFEFSVEQGTEANQFDFAGIASGKIFKCFVWDNLGNIKPLYDNLVYSK